MLEVENRLIQLLEKAQVESIDISPELLTEFGELCKNTIRKHFMDKKETKFRLRMSSVGKDLRQLHLEKLHGRQRKSHNFKVLTIYGDLIENLFMFLLKASGTTIEEGKPVTLELAGERIDGTPDLKILGKMWDIKSASSYSYDWKFKSFTSLSTKDSLGYVPQLFGYAEADKVPVGGWLVVNKSDGNFKFLEVPDEEYEQARATSLDRITKTIEHFKNDSPIPPCTGSIKETFNGKPTGNECLTGDCEWCEHKTSCHGSIIYAEEALSKAKNRKMKYYTKLVNTGESNV